MNVSSLIIFSGIILIVVGLIVGGRLGPLGHLPGDVLIQKQNATFYFPITTMIILSVIVSIIVRIFFHR